MANPNGIEIFQLGDLKLQSDEILSEAFLAYRTFGNPENPAIINPTWYTGGINDAAKLIHDSHASLNPSKYFIIVPALIGNGESISPSNTPALRSSFPAVTFADNVHAQYCLVTEKLHIKHVKAIVGWSMGAGQSYQWAVQYPDFMDFIAPICGSAKTAIHNNVFLEGVKAALIAPRGGSSLGIGKGQTYTANESWTDEQRKVGLKAFARVYAGWGFSQAWYREEVHVKHFGAKDADDFMGKFWEAWALTNDPDDALVMLRTWQLGDISASKEFGGDLKKALRSIKAKALVLPCDNDLYFPPEDSQFEVENMTPGVGTLVIIPSIWGHWAGGPGDSKEDWMFIDEKLGQFFGQG